MVCAIEKYEKQLLNFKTNDDPNRLILDLKFRKQLPLTKQAENDQEERIDNVQRNEIGHNEQEEWYTPFMIKMRNKDIPANKFLLCL